MLGVHELLLKYVDDEAVPLFLCGPVIHALHDEPHLRAWAERIAAGLEMTLVAFSLVLAAFAGMIEQRGGIIYNTTMLPRVVLDTNVLVSALRSRKGASFRVVSLIGKDLFQLSVSVPLVLEYEDAAKRISRLVGLSHADIDDILDYICKAAEHREIYYLWRPFLRDPKDDMVLEVAIESGAQFVVTHNVRDFAGIEEFGVEAVTPRQFLEKIGELS